MARPRDHHQALRARPVRAHLPPSRLRAHLLRRLRHLRLRRHRLHLRARPHLPPDRDELGLLDARREVWGSADDVSVACVDRSYSGFGGGVLADAGRVGSADGVVEEVGY